MTGHRNTEHNALSYGVVQTQALRFMAARQAEVWGRLQSDVLDSINELTLGWIQRRREAATAA